ncbi:histone H1-like [Acanthochromis polyacanthus]|uniref:histone H1-like n=1 Tax=Acanthochromis polyacanthus TaxID=80966 RepID=UPI002234CB9C|nr:histone H1-like [Acanthochromis polyacanthus]
MCCLFTVLMVSITPASCVQLGYFETNRRRNMAEEAPAAAPAKAPAKAPKKKASRPKQDGPSLPKLIVAAVAESKERKGISLAAIKKVLGSKNMDVAKANKRINTAITKLVTKGVLSQTKGTGASGSFKLAKKEPKVSKPVKKVSKKKAPVKAKKPTPAKAKKPVAAKKAPAKKTSVKRSPKKAAPKKAVKKAPKKSPKKPAAKKPKPAAKKPAAKKSAAKKPKAKKAVKK